MATTDPRVLRTRAALHRALLALTSDGATEVTVTALCERSGLNRGTFYLHYQDVNELTADVAQSLVESIVSPWKEMQNDDRADFTAQSKTFLTDYLRHIDQQRDFYSWILSTAGSWHVVKTLLDDYAEAIGHALDRQTTRASDEQPQALLASYLAGALFGVISRWVANPPSVTPEVVSEWLWRELEAHPVD